MPGLDNFVKEFRHLKEIPLGVLSNNAVLSVSGYPASLELVRNGFNVKRLFSPEHGITSQGEDGKEQLSETDSLTRLPIVSLYGKSFQPAEADLKDIDCVIIDLPNIGCRFYTYWWTITLMVESCAKVGKKIILLDRPNLSRRIYETSEGPMLDEQCSSFLGRWSMPLTWSYSFGELLPWFINERKIPSQLQIVPFHHKTGYETVFVPPSPSIPDWPSILLYPFTGLFEGLNLNTGRGTAFPFKVLGAPWLDPVSLHEDFTSQNFQGLSAVPYSYRPEWSRFAGQICHGLFFRVNDPITFRPVHVGLWLMNHLSLRYPEKLEEASYPTMANPDGKNHLDLLIGVKNSFVRFCSGEPLPASAIDDLLDVTDWTRKINASL